MLTRREALDSSPVRTVKYARRIAAAKKVTVADGGRKNRISTSGAVLVACVIAVAMPAGSSAKQDSRLGQQTPAWCGSNEQSDWLCSREGRTTIRTPGAAGEERLGVGQSRTVPARTTVTTYGRSRAWFSPAIACSFGLGSTSPTVVVTRSGESGQVFSQRSGVTTCTSRSGTVTFGWGCKVGAACPVLLTTTGHSLQLTVPASTRRKGTAEAAERIRTLIVDLYGGGRYKIVARARGGVSTSEGTASASGGTTGVHIRVVISFNELGTVLKSTSSTVIDVKSVAGEIREQRDSLGLPPID